MRGNVLTRLDKLDRGEYGALVLAAAGLHRLGLENRITRYFAPDELIPAAGQAILAVQGREGELADEVKKLDNADAHDCALAERSFVKTLGGGCFAPVAAYAETEGDMLHLRGLYVTGDESRSARGAVTGPRSEAASLGRTLALQLQKQAEGTL